jgi:hypothetical protein
MLLLLDNCEHLIESVARLCESVLGSCPDVGVLATSREPLATGGEVLWRVPSLALPASDAGVPEDLSAADAVTLFCERARAADPEFRLTPGNAAAVARICRRLDGIPLALELAAARVPVLSPDEVADRLDHRFRLLSTGPRTAAARQQTLRPPWTGATTSSPRRNGPSSSACRSLPAASTWRPPKRWRGDNVVAHALAALAPLAALAGDGERALGLAEEGAETARHLGLFTNLIMTLTRAAEVGILLRSWAGAEAALRESLALLRDTGGRAFLADPLEMVAPVRATQGAPGPAARLLGAAEGIREVLGESSDVRAISAELERCHAQVRQSLGATDFAGEWARGRELSPVAAVSYALEELEGRDAPTRMSAPPTADPAPGTLRRQEKHWVMGHGDALFELPDMKGLRYLARLLAQPGCELHVLDLAAAGGGEAAGGAPDRGDAGPVLDERAKAEYRRRVRELQGEIEEAESWNDPERAATAQLELEALTRQLAAAVGLGGRDRPAASAAERARVSVRKAVATAIARIAEHDADLGLLLSTTVKTGTYCSYTPDPRLPVAWSL